MKVETHNHPTAISPFPGAATGSGGEIRDEGATGPRVEAEGRAVRVLGVEPAHPRLRAALGRPGVEARPHRVAARHHDRRARSARPRSTTSSAGRTSPATSARTSRTVDGVVRGYHKPIMLAGGVGNIQRRARAQGRRAGRRAASSSSAARACSSGWAAASASSMTTGANTADLDFDSVQRGNAEIQRRAQEVIDRCWALGDGEPDPLDPRRRRGRPVERAARARPRLRPRRPHRPARGAERRARHDAARGVVQRGAGALRARDRARRPRPRSRALCERERCPFAVVGARRPATTGSWCTIPLFGNDAGRHGPAGAARQAAADDAGRRARRAPRPAVRHRPAVASPTRSARVLRAPAVADKTFLISIGDRTVGGLCSRDQMVGPWQVPGRRLRDHAAGVPRLRRRGVRDRRAHAARRPRTRPASGRMAVAEALTNLAAAPVRALSLVKLSANWMAAAGAPGEDAALFDTVRAVALELCPRSASASRSARTRCRCARRGPRATSRARSVSPVSLIVSAFAPCDDVRGTWTPQLRTDAGPTVAGAGRSAPAGARGSAARCWRRSSARPATETPDVDDPAAIRGLFAALRGAARRRARARVPRSVRRRPVRHAAARWRSPGTRASIIDADAIARERRHGRWSPALFAEELGAVIQVRDADAAAVAGRARVARPVGARRRRPSRRRPRHDPCADGAVVFTRARASRCSARGARRPGRCSRCATTRRRAQQEYDRILDAADPGISPVADVRPRATTSPRRSSRRRAAAASPSCASRA